jgi:formylglycine-generating enzyme required for sulfatase activity
MKKILIAAFFISILFLSCAKKNPTGPIQNTPTKSTTETITSTRIQTNTATETVTNTYSHTITLTPTLSETIAQTSSDTVTPTITPTVTQTSTYTTTRTITPTATITLTITPISTIDFETLMPVLGGTFTQTDGTNSFSHTISNFRIGKYEVTYILWYTVYQWAISNGYTFANAGMEGNNGTIGAAPTAAKYEPVTSINWRDIIVWCNAYSQMTGLAPVYCSDSGFTTPIKNSTDGVYGGSINITPGSFDNPYVNWSANGYRLPTEGEWQYAASYKDGSTWTSYNHASGDAAPYDTSLTIGNYCWYSTNSGSVTHNVGGKTANALGIYDMSGNAYEWCWDWYGAYPGTSTDYRGSASGSSRVLRGGYFSSGADRLQLGYRGGSNPYDAYNGSGFRFARTY